MIQTPQEWIKENFEINEGCFAGLHTFNTMQRYAEYYHSEKEKEKCNLLEVKIDFHDYSHFDGKDQSGYYAHMPNMKGMGESGDTPQLAFKELMIGLAVKIHYENKLDFELIL